MIIAKNVGGGGGGGGCDDCNENIIIPKTIANEISKEFLCVL